MREKNWFALAVVLTTITTGLFAGDFVIIYPVLHPFFSATSRGAREEAARHDDVELTITAPFTQSSADQIALFERFVEADVDAIAIGPADDDLTPAIDRAIREGIPVICIDTDAPDSGRAAYIGTNNYRAGFEMGLQVMEYLPEGGKILISVSNLKTRNMIQRVAGFKDVVGKDGMFVVVAVEEGMANSDTIFQKIERHIEADDFNAIVTMDAESGPMVVRMWKAWGLDHPVFCFDDPDLVLEGLADGVVKVAVIQNQYEWGRQAVRAMIDLSKGETVPGFIDTGIRVEFPPEPTSTP